ncbi:metallophosphoesterase [Roseimicrobium sp. ORNL1]|uniref:metallophosphoesterase n=1 Tax=Roseimicrobium sp. ORNL1 TaxID=2711231 RepID=UPI0013E1EF55|nr:metallophosphoesterase [Roseimicrobium sp. ORNL1]QIF03049.1 metallophosphoesterase [Roseimicrobium sp. ORNL1]
MKHWLSRRRFLGQSAATLAAGWASTATAEELDGEFESGSIDLSPGQRVKETGPRVVRVSVELPHLPPAMDGFRIAQISDLHLEPYTTPRQIARVVKLCNSLQPDLVAMTGDFVTYNARPAVQLAEILSELKATYGVYASLGNHDFQSGHEHVVYALEQQKIPVLRNVCRTIHTDKGDLHLAGMDSRYVSSPNLRSTLESWRENQPLVMMMHEPDVADDLADAKLHALQLSGHTHGGQLVFMGMQPSIHRRAKWGKKYLAGAYNVGTVRLYVNRGIGTVGVPLRVQCPPEVTEITLRSPELRREMRV